ncbi:MAG: autotransporter domain-containing protein [Elusimicrobiota bacterium]|jgi:autotransporter-associated beta strand protein/predicted outer membrane repeat protein|nr:autotransporter domain-containing protein [Elusimicrobiota bacterium]
MKNECVFKKAAIFNYKIRILLKKRYIKMTKFKNALKIKFFYVFAVLFFAGIQVYGADISDWTAFNSAYSIGGAVNLSSSISVGANIGGFSGNYLSIKGNGFAFIGNDKYGFSLSSKTVSLEDIAFNGFNSSHWGGAIFADQGSNISFSGKKIEFSSNFATASNDASAGAIFIGNTNGEWTTISFNDVHVDFLGNIAAANGGAIHSYEASSITFKGVGKTINFISNTGKAGNGNFRGGGAIFAIGSSNRQAFIGFNDVHVNFIGNLSNNDGGAIFANDYSNIDFSNTNVSFISNSAVNSGGAVYVNAGSLISISGSGKFAGNSAGYNGGAFFIDNANLNLIANKGDFVFEYNNAKNGKDIYMNGASNLKLDAQGNNIIMKGGIAGADTQSTITKEGDGQWLLSGNNDYKGAIQIKKGDFVLKNIIDAKFGSITIDNGAKFSIAQAANTIYVDKMTINGIYEIGLNLESGLLKTDITSATDTITIGEQSKLNILSNFSYEDLQASIGAKTLLYAQNGISGVFSNTDSVYLGRGFGYNFDYKDKALYIVITSGTTPEITTSENSGSNERGIIDALNNLGGNTPYYSDLMDIKDYLYGLRLSGSDLPIEFVKNLGGEFMVDVLPLSLINKDYNSRIYSKINETKEVGADISKSIWVQGGIAGLENKKSEIANFKNDVFGIQAGFNFLTSKDLVLGAYIGYDSNKVSQGDNKADIDDIQLGVYGGYFDSWFNIRWNMTGARQSFKTNRTIVWQYQHRNPQADFDAFNISGGFEIEFPVWLSSRFDLKPFIGAQGGYASNDEIKEKDGGDLNLTIRSGDYARLGTLAGVKLSMNTGKVSAYIKGYGEYTAIGNEAEYAMFFSSNPTSDWKVKSEDIDDFLIGAGLGIEWFINDTFSVSANADYKINSDMQRYFVNGAVNYRFGAKANAAIASADDHQDIAYSQEPEIVTADFEPITNTGQDVFTSQDTYPQSFSSQDYVAQTETQSDNTAETLVAAPPSVSEPPAAVAAAIKPIAVKSQIHKIALKPKTKTQLAQERAEEARALEPERIPEDKAIENLIDTKSSVELDQMTDEELLAAVDEESVKFKKPLEKKVNLLVSTFKNNAVELTNEVKESVKKLANNLKQYAFKKVTVEGHSDSKGGVKNFLTSKLRARSVYAALREEGIPADKIEYKGMGSQKPIVSNKTAYGQQENRRVEITVE